MPIRLFLFILTCIVLSVVVKAADRGCMRRSIKDSAALFAESQDLVPLIDVVVKPQLTDR